MNKKGQTFWPTLYVLSQARRGKGTKAGWCPRRKGHGFKTHRVAYITAFQIRDMPVFLLAISDMHTMHPHSTLFTFARILHFYTVKQEPLLAFYPCQQAMVLSPHHLLCMEMYANPNIDSLPIHKGNFPHPSFETCLHTSIYNFKARFSCTAF